MDDNFIRQCHPWMKSTDEVTDEGHGRSLRVEESFWTKKQSCKLLKVDITKWRPFFVFVCFNDAIF